MLRRCRSTIFRELKRNHNENVNLINALRQLISLFGTEIVGDDVEEVIKETNAWLDRAIKPIAQSSKELSEDRRNDGRSDEEDDHTQTPISNTEINQSVREDEAPMEHDMTHTRGDDREM